jgi:hypothetical protein
MNWPEIPETGFQANFFYVIIACTVGLEGLFRYLRTLTLNAFRVNSVRAFRAAAVLRGVRLGQGVRQEKLPSLPR